MEPERTGSGLWTRLRRGWPILLAGPVLGAGLGIGVSAITDPIYTARTQLFVSPAQGGTASDQFQASNLAVRQVKTYLELVESPTVLAPVAAELGISLPSLQDAVSAESPLDTTLINVTADGHSAGRAAEIADAVAQSLADVVSGLATGTAEPGTEDDASEEPPARIEVIQHATHPEHPSSPDIVLNTLLGVITGVGGSMGILTLGRASRVLWSRHDAERIDGIDEADVLGEVPVGPSRAAPAETGLRSFGDAQLEALRRIRLSLQFTSSAGAGRIIVVTSAVRGEGKTEMARGLATAIAHAGFTTLLIDANLRPAPTRREQAAADSPPGLMSILRGTARLPELAQTTSVPMLSTLPTGGTTSDSSEALGSTRMAEFLAEAARSYEFVIIDSPSVEDAADPLVLGRVAGGLYLVIGLGLVEAPDVARAVQTIRDARVRLSGCIVNHPRRRAAGRAARLRRRP